MDTEERSEIEAALLAGASQNSVAKRFNRSPGTVGRIARELGLTYTAPTKANAARRKCCLERRLELIGKAFDRVDELLPTCEKPSQLRELATALAILCDKVRLEEGQPTSIVSSRGDVENARERLARLAASAAAGS